jgi:hypothetical protein
MEMLEEAGRRKERRLTSMTANEEDGFIFACMAEEGGELVSILP